MAVPSVARVTVAAQCNLDLLACQRDARLPLKTFRDRYAGQLDALWSALGRLGMAQQRVGPIMSRDADDRVARLVQSAAFAAAYADLRADNESEHLIFPTLARAIPEVVRPKPAATIVGLTSANPTNRMEEPGSKLDATRGAIRAKFVTSWQAICAPVEVVDARIVRPNPSTQVLTFVLAAAAGVVFGAAMRQTLRVFIGASFAIDLIHALRGTEAKVRALSAEGHVVAELTLPDAVRWVRVDTEEPPLVATSRTSPMPTGELLSDLFTFRESFAFFDLDVAPLRATPEKARRLEISLPLACVVPGAESISARDLCLGCTPAVNTFATSIERAFLDGERAVVLQLAEDPLAEILEVRSVQCGAGHGTVSNVPLYERTTPGNALLGGVLARLRRSPSVVGDRTDVELGFFSVDRNVEPPPGPHLSCGVLATQRHACVDLGPGDVVRAGAANISRVARGQPLRWGNELAWRHNAYARMPCAELGGRSTSIDAFVSLYDPASDLSEPERRVLSASCSRGQRLLQGVVQHGLHFEVEVEAAAFSGEGEAWLLGELVARSLAERDDQLRYSRLVWRTTHGSTFDFGARPGRQWPSAIA